MARKRERARSQARGKRPLSTDRGRQKRRPCECGRQGQPAGVLICRFNSNVSPTVSRGVLECDAVMLQSGMFMILSGKQGRYLCRTPQRNPADGQTQQCALGWSEPSQTRSNLSDLGLFLKMPCHPDKVIRTRGHGSALRAPEGRAGHGPAGRQGLGPIGFLSGPLSAWRTVVGRTFSGQRLFLGHRRDSGRKRGVGRTFLGGGSALWLQSLPMLPLDKMIDSPEFLWKASRVCANAQLSECSTRSCGWQ